MNAPLTPPTGSSKSGCGCFLYTLLGLVVLAVALVGGGYLAAMHTSLPFKTIASMIEAGSANSHLRISGLSGSISSGIGIHSITWDDGELADVKVTYNGLHDLITNKELILHEVQVGKAHMTVSNWNKENTTKSETKTQNKDNQSPSSTSKGQAQGSGLKLFRIDHLILSDIALTNPLDGFEMSIPKIELKGFEAKNGHFTFDSFTADSDRLQIVTQAATTPGFKKRVDMTLLPKMSPKIRQPIHVLADMGADAWHLTGFDGKMEFDINPDHSGALHCKNLNLADYYDAPLPQEINLDISTAKDPVKGNFPMKVGPGSFKLGLRTFDLKPQAFSTDKQPPPEGHVDLAVSHAADGDIAFQLQPVKEGSDDAKLVLASQPPASLQDTVAKMYYAKPYADLQPGEQKSVDAKVSFFSFAKFQTDAAPTPKSSS